MLVSIIIPLFNRERLIIETLESIKNQSYELWECIIIDDNSTDNSFETVKNYISIDKRFSILKRPNNRPKGANSCRNYGFEISKGDFINWFDSDDVMDANFLQEKVNQLRESNLDGVISKTAVFRENPSTLIGKETRTRLTENSLEDFLSLKIAWYLPDVMWRRRFLEDKQLFNNKLMAGQDRDFHTRMLLHTPNLKVIDRYLTFYRKHESNITSNLDNTDNVKLKMSHMNSVFGLIDKINEAGQLTKNIKVNLFASMIKYLPFTLDNKSDLKTLKSLLKKLSFPNTSIIIGWIKFYFSLFSFKLFGKGSRVLK